MDAQRRIKSELVVGGPVIWCMSVDQKFRLASRKCGLSTYFFNFVSNGGARHKPILGHQ